MRWGQAECDGCRFSLMLPSEPFLEAFSHCKAGTHSPAVGLVVYPSLLHCVWLRGSWDLFEPQLPSACGLLCPPYHPAPTEVASGTDLSQIVVIDLCSCSHRMSPEEEIESGLAGDSCCVPKLCRLLVLRQRGNPKRLVSQKKILESVKKNKAAGWRLQVPWPF